MKGLTILGIAAAAAVIYWYEWPKIGKKLKKEKASFLVLLSLGVLLSIYLLYFPEASGPTDMVEAIFHMLEKLFA